LITGPLVKGVFFELGGGDGADGNLDRRNKLLLIVHHLVVDAVS